eukprot:XP_012826229.1 PREDICTED: perforin-1-like [Xenopus tropicalis]
MVLHLLVIMVLLISPIMPLYHNSVCKEGTKTECDDAPLVPGHMLLAGGIDIVTMKHMEAFLLDMTEYMKNSRCTLCKDPQHNAKWWKLPRALEGWKYHGPCKTEIESKTLRSTVSMAKEAASIVQNKWDMMNLTSATTQGSLLLAGSHSKITEFALEKCHFDKYTFIKHQLECELYSFQLSKDYEVSHHFMEALEQLPGDYNANTKVSYFNLISTYGTHFISKATIGGRAQEIAAVRTCEVALSGMTMEQTKGCLDEEVATAVHNMGSPSLGSKECADLAVKYNFIRNFHQAFSERIWQVTGGNSTFNLLDINAGANQDAATRWINSTERFPDLLRYSLIPIDALLDSESPEKYNLKMAIRDYIKEKSMNLRCPCPEKAHLDQTETCTCSCPPSQYTNSDCCPTVKGLATLKVKINYALYLTGDLLAADGYVKFFFDILEKKSRTLWNTQNPMWNEWLDFGTVVLSPEKKYRLEVWDEDFISRDDLIFDCEGSLTAGNTENIRCSFGRMVTYFSLYVTCGPYLHGQFCEKHYRAA